MSKYSIALHWKQEERISKLLGFEERRVVRRINILSCMHNGMTIELTSRVLHVDPKTVRNVCATFIERGLDAALFDDERSGRPIDIDDRERSRIVAMVCEDPPPGYSRWTLDLIVEEVNNRQILDRPNISRETVRLILEQHDLKPWQQKMWCIEEMTPEYIERMEDILDVYELDLNPKRPVVCLDEKPVQLTSDARGSLPMKEGRPKTVDYEYKREGTCSIFTAVEPKAGKYMNEVSESRKGEDFTRFLMKIADEYSQAERIILVMDNLSTHFVSSVIKTLGETEGAKLWDRFEVHYTPKHASWLNQAEIAIGMLSRQCIGKVRQGDIASLKRQVALWTQATNTKGITINWRFTKSKARKSLRYEK